MTDDIHSRSTSVIARAADPLPSAHLVWPADLAVRAALAVMPFSAIAWMFVAH